VILPNISIIGGRNFIKVTSATDIKKLITLVFLDFDLMLLKKIEEKSNGKDCNYSVGSTAGIVLFTGNSVWVANVGDTEVLLSKANCPVTALTKKHNPSDFDEQNRILSSGGSIFAKRVNGIIAVSRSFGDFAIVAKGKKLVIAEPYIINISESEPFYILIASDGVFDTVTYDMADSIIRKTEDLNSKSVDLVTTALKLGSRDNITAMVICVK
jgi:serine/threonine protein phosphatase PrpC